MTALLFLALLSDVPVEEEDAAPAPEAATEAEPEALEPPPEPPKPRTGPDAVTTTMIAGGAACLGMGLAFLAHLPVAAVMAVASVCPVVALTWGIYATCAMPFVVGEAGAFTAQVAVKSFAHKRVVNMVLLAGGAAVLGAGVGLYTLGSTVFTAILTVVFVIVVAAPQLTTVALVVLAGLAISFFVLTVSSWVVTMLAAASAVGALAGYTGRRLYEGEPSDGTDWLRIPPYPPEEPLVDEEFEEEDVDGEVVPDAPPD